MEELKENQMIILSADDILQGKVELDKELVSLSGGRAVYVREMTGTEKNKWEVVCMKKTPAIGNQKATMDVTLDNYYVKIALFTVCDKDGNRLFGDEWLLPKKLSDLGSKFKATDLEEIVKAANRINKITPEDQKELMGNSEADQVIDSVSDSA